MDLITDLNSELSWFGHMPVRIPRKDPREELPNGIILRLSAAHDPNSITLKKCIQTIVRHLWTHINPSDISYACPNFFIRLKEPITQANILTNKILRFDNCSLEMVPWCKEHKWGQIPWITAYTPQIIIDPLTILPITSTVKTKKAGTKKGSSRLKDFLSAKIPSGYDLKAPDYSYLLIAELKDLYKKKFEIFSECANLSYHMRSMLEDLTNLIEQEISLSCSCTKDNHDVAIHTIEQVNLGCVGDLLCHLLSASNRINDFYIPVPITGTKLPPLQLNGFTDAPMRSEIPLPRTYTVRLKTIYTAVIEKLYMTKPIIETIQSDEGNFETFITIGQLTFKHLGEYKKTSIEQEVSAIYYSLKHITHIIGYSIVDLNHSTLKTLVEHINIWNAQINTLHLHAAYAIAEIQAIHESLKYLAQCNPAIIQSEYCKCLQSAIKNLLCIADNKLRGITGKGSKFIDLKNKYQSSWKKSDSLVLRHCRWTGAQRPTNTHMTDDVPST